jgi:hypothetical protein
LDLSGYCYLISSSDMVGICLPEEICLDEEAACINDGILLIYWMLAAIRS